MRITPRALLIGSIVAAGCFSAGALGGFVATSNIVAIDKLVAALASFGSVAAAGATLLTIREMKAARIEAARGRVSVSADEQILSLALDLRDLRIGATKLLPSIKIRNASPGVARNIHLTWKISDPINKHDMKLIGELSNQRMTAVASADHFIRIANAGGISRDIPVAASDSLYAGDLGPLQEQAVEFPALIVHHLFLCWLARIQTVEIEGPLSPSKVPTVELIFEHESPYGENLIDVQILKFELSRQKYNRLRGIASDRPIKNWVSVELDLTTRASSHALEARSHVTLE
jgi:hypothetical protein